MTRKNKIRHNIKKIIPKNSPFDNVFDDKLIDNKLIDDKVLHNILEGDLFEDVTLEINGQSFPLYNKFNKEYNMIWETLSDTGKNKLYQRDYLFLIYHKNLYNGRLHKIQIINYIKKHFITRYEFDKIGMTHLMCACIYSQNDSNLELVKLFISGFNIYKTDNTDRSALVYSLKNSGNIKIIKFLLNYLKDFEPYNYSRIINDTFINWSKTDYLPDINMAKILLDAGAFINYKDLNNSTVLINIINNKKYGDVTELVKFLLVNNIDIYVKTTINPNDVIVQNIKWTNYVSKKLVESIEFDGIPMYPMYDVSDEEPKYDIMDHLIERYHRDSNKKIISMLYDYGYRKLPNTKNELIMNFTKNIIDDIDFRESYFRKIKGDLIEKQNEILYKPVSLRSEIIKLSWNLHSGIPANLNNNIFNHFGINNEIELKKVICDVYSGVY
ncbi:ankyrin repeat protein [Megavirus chiliensis]|uniref:Ankyrin repeat protein n=2 Tax=Megamimivirinae TaxID=3044648 RepID=A0A2L2DP61_MIMIV|nr:putative ankyrin repeat protein [Megavirus chiliensis]AEQ32618.1 ankyrin repeat protein [Megavirus chiliensis]AVG47944.1 ankyrin repeat protein [Acanthamoeba polyphaga mimivirus]